MKKINKIWIAGLALAAGLLWASSAFAIGAELPFYAAANAQPNVLLVPDTSTSLRWGINGSNSPGVGQRRIDILKRVLSGEETTPLLYQGNQVYRGVVGGEFSVYADLFGQGQLVEVLLVHERIGWPGIYELVSTDYYRLNFGTENFYYVFEDFRDAMFGDVVALATVDAARYSLDQILRDYNVDSALEGSVLTGYTVDLYNDGFTGLGNRMLMIPSASGGSNLVAIGDQFTKHYSDKQDRDIIRVIKVNSCYKQGSNWKACYRPSPFSSSDPVGTDTFVIMGSTDYANIVLAANNNPFNLTNMKDAKKTITEFIAYYNMMNHTTDRNAYLPNTDPDTPRTLCGDGTLYSHQGGGGLDPNINCPDDNRQVDRTINRLAVSTTAGAIKMVYTADEIAANISGALPNVGEVMAGDTSVGPEFVKNTALGTQRRIDTQVRMGLSYATTSVTLNGACLNSRNLCNFFNNDAGRFSGLPYAALKIEHPGIIDNYDVRWGLMISVSGGGGLNEDFPQPGNSNTRGGNLIFNYSDDPVAKVHLKEIIRQKDLDGDGNIYVVQEDFNNPAGTAVMQWLLRDIFSYNYACFFGSADPEGVACEFNTSGAPGYDPNPSMFHHWDYEQYGLPNYNGHILLNDPYFYNKCRKNYAIMVTDGSQRGGGGNVGTQLVSSVNYMKNFPDPSLVISEDDFQPTKFFFIAYAMIDQHGDPLTDSLNLLNEVASYSVITDWPNDAIWNHALIANSEDELALALKTIMDTIMEGTFTRSTPAINNTMDAAVAGYFDVIPAVDYLWRGHLVYLALLSPEDLPEGSATIDVTVDAADRLNSRTLARDIFTSQKVGSAWQKLDFTAGNSGTLAPLLFLNYPTPPTGYLAAGDTGLDDNDVDNLINFLRSENSPTFQIGNTLTDRTWKLGAIYHSTPISMGAPPPEALPNMPKYQKYAELNSAAPEIAYVGALDGMLHAFFFSDPDGSGSLSLLDEAFAYIPNYHLNNLYPLRKGIQNVYADGDATLGVMSMAGVLDAATSICENVSGRCWQTMLFSGLRDGGPAYFALNVSKVILDGSSVKPWWEFTDPDDSSAPRDPILGASWSKPYVEEALYDTGTLDTKLILIFGGGKSILQRPYEGSWLYILDADSGNPLRVLLVPSIEQHCEVSGWAQGEELPGDLLLAGMLGGSSFSMDQCDETPNLNQVPGNAQIKDVDDDEFPDWIYFGDLEGRMWKANIHDPDPEKWGLCLFFDTGDTGYDVLNDIQTDCNGDLRDYGATQPSCVDTEKRRPIFYRPIIIPSPDGDGWMLYFGTGHIEDALESSDTTHINYIFAVRDSDTVGECTYGEMYGGSYNLAYLETGGWPIKLSPGEKLISSPQIVNPLVYESEVSFTTYSPFEGADVCKPGTTFRWQVDTASGKGALTNSEGFMVRKKATPGLAGRSLVIGDIMVTPILPGAPDEDFQAGFERTKFDLLNGFYYWWIK